MSTDSCTPDPSHPVSLTLENPLVLVGLMGAGKTRVGGLIARMLEIPFIDSDMEIERAAGMPVSGIFDSYGEQAFRDCEAKVIDRLLAGPAKVIATGGGAFINAATRAAIKTRGTSVWLKADIEVLLARTAHSGKRPLLQVDDPAAVLRRLMDQRYPVYSQADIVVDSGQQSPQDMAKLIITAVANHLLEKRGGA